MKTEHSAMHNQIINCWTNSSIKDPSQTYRQQTILNGHNNQIQINQNASCGSFSSSDQSAIVNLSSDYSFNSSTNSTNLNLSNNNLVTSTMNNVQLINQITMPIVTTNHQINTQINDQYSINTIKSTTATTQPTSMRNLPRCFNDIPTLGKDKNRITKKK